MIATNTAVKTEVVYMNDSYNDIIKMNKDSAADRARIVSIVMRYYEDDEMADTLNILSGQLDFEDSCEATDAINRTQDKLDALIKDRKQHYSSNYIHMLTKNQIRNMAGGEVTDGDYSFIKSSYLKNGLFDPDIFGGSGKIPVIENKNDKYDVSSFGTGMGFITLPCHVVLSSNYHTIARLLNMTTSDVEKVAKYVSYVVVDPCDTDLKKGQIIPEKDYAGYNKDAVLMCGGDAIYHMLKDLNYSDKPERLAFDTIPVVAPCVRPVMYCREDDTFCTHPLNSEYNRVINRVNRLKKLKDLGVPAVIEHNECRMLNEYVESLMDCIKQTILSKKKRKNNTVDGYQMFCINQLSIARMISVFSAKTIKPVKTGEIESLGIYPEMIKVKMNNGRIVDAILENIYDTCVDVIGQARTDNMVVIPDGCDPDNLPPELQKEVDKADELINSMEDTLDKILEGAKAQRENFTVKISDHGINGMYVPI